MTARRSAPAVLLLLLTAAVWWQPLASTLRLALNNDEYTHILLILPISASLIFLERRRLSWDIRPAYGLSGFFLFLALLLYALAKWQAHSLPEDISLFLSMVSVVICLVAAALLWLGLNNVRV